MHQNTTFVRALAQTMIRFVHGLASTKVTLYVLASPVYKQVCSRTSTDYGGRRCCGEGTLVLLMQPALGLDFTGVLW